jgi:TIR domain
MSDAQSRWEPPIRPPITPEPADKSTGPPPQAFLSYAWESDSHARWVYNLATRLQEKSGVRIILDQWDLPLGSDQFIFMERSVKNSNFVIVICTPTYAEKANSREGGVGYETRVITGEFAKQIESRKFIPVLRIGDWDSSAPIYLRPIYGVDLRNDPYSEAQYEQLIRALHNKPVQPPPVGPKPEFAIKPAASTAIPTVIPSPVQNELGTKSNQVKWKTSYPGPCIDVTVTNSREVIEAGQAVGLEYPGPRTMKALLDTGAAVTVISKTFARYCKLLQTGETEIRTLGQIQKCGEHAGAISFPGTNLRPIDPIRIVSGDFIKEQYYACLIGWDILRNWTVTFEGRCNCVTITDRSG